ncbi:MAG: alcohol dehydrogenase catalytic domain-containing protein [Candidatus Bathyarchaeota archaeon]|jgi:threonine dehydrogenase-like Zn-dependent dehydrogenase|nr:alcohol dehydrogenase catalytic domain-containing protein [Candidatus Bathyarchaeota archaeon]
MKALLYRYRLPRLAFARIAGLFCLRGFLTKLGFLGLKEIPKPKIKTKDWVVVKTRLCGICGSDHKQVFLDGNKDNPMTALISWPQILGHEAVGIVENTGSNVNLKKGDRIALNPWISCVPRSIKPVCNACQNGKNSLCRNFNKGILSPGIHTGNSSDATGGFAEYFPAHESMAIPIPDDINWEQAMLSDAFSVAFHSVLKADLKPGSICAVYGCGNLGLLTILILKHLIDEIQVIAISRFSHQADMAKKFGADLVINSSPPHYVIEQIADYLLCNIYYKRKKSPWLIEGVDVLFDTVYSPETIETGLRIVKARKKDPQNNKTSSGFIIFTGLSSPKRYEWTPWYFKEITMIGSNAFAIEEFKGIREHSYYHYYRYLQEGRLDPSPMITHRFTLEKYKKALITARNQKKYKSIKVAFSFENSEGRRI